MLPIDLLGSGGSARDTGFWSLLLVFVFVVVVLLFF